MLGVVEKNFRNWAERWILPYFGKVGRKMSDFEANIIARRRCIVGYRQGHPIQRVFRPNYGRRRRKKSVFWKSSFQPHKK
jgi:hypothetical protein